MSDQKDHTEEPKDDVEGHRFREPDEKKDQKDEPDVEGHVFDKSEKQEHFDKSE